MLFFGSCLTQLEIAELFQTSKQNVSLHTMNIFEDNELRPEAVVKESLTAQKRVRTAGAAQDYPLQPRRQAVCSMSVSSYCMASSKDTPSPRANAACAAWIPAICRLCVARY